MLKEFGKDSAPMFQIRFYEVDGKEVCCVTFKPSHRPVYIKEGNATHFYIRAGNSKRQLTTKETVDYCKQHWV